MGDSLRKAKTWKFVVEDLMRRLVVLRGRNLSIGGIMVLINSMLNAMPIFTLSFYMAPTNIIKEILKIQSNFLWGSSYNLKHIDWINWN